MSQKSIDDNKIKNASLRCSPVKKFNIALEAIKRKYIDDIEKENTMVKYKPRWIYTNKQLLTD